MLRERQYILRQTSLALDCLLALAAVLAAHGVRQLLSMYVMPGWLAPARLGNYLWVLAAAPPVTVAVLAWQGLYQPVWVRTRTREVAGRLALACATASVLLMAINFLLGGRLNPAGVGQASRALILILAPVSFTLILAKTWLLRRWLMRRRRLGRDLRRVVVAGSGAPMRDFLQAIAGNPLWGMEVVALITDRPDCQGAAFDPAAVPERTLGYPIAADLTRAADLLWRTPVDEVILTPGGVPLPQLRPLLELCEEMGVRTHLPLNFFQGVIARPLIDHFEAIPVLSYWPTRPMGPALLFKYAFDRIAAAALLAVLAVPMAAIALAIRATARPGEGALFGQVRCGLNGRLFKMWKFRTMSLAAEEQRAALEPQSLQDGPAFKMAGDPRVTPLGRWLRKFSLDELPQLWNVARGEMSLVGPRPPLPGEVERYDRWQRRRLSMKPGMTCIWQVSGRNRLSFETWMTMDLEYIDHWSLWLDFKILMKTGYVVVSGYGGM